MSSWRSGSFSFGTPVSGSSVREVIASYRRAQYLAVGSTVASVSDESDEIDEEALIGSTFEEEEEPDDLEEENLPTPTVPSSQDDHNVFVDQFQWDDFENTQTTTETPLASSFPSPRRRAERRPPQVHEGTPLLKSKTSRLSTASGTRSTPAPTEGSSYGLSDSGDASHTGPVRRLSATTKAESKQHLGGQSTFGQTVR
ncbi:hypothetical protein C8R42DRAFT_97223 [Lentinula raphanica]|nr:hypothetical protein C8R42DRAFT_97223 [Lentinula raphanica]